MLAVLAIAALLPVVALASRPEGGRGGPPLGVEPARVAVDVVTYLFLAAALLGLGILVWVFWPRPNEELPPLPRRRRGTLTMAAAAGLAVLVVLWLRSHHFGQLPNLAPPGVPGNAQATPPDVAPGAPAPSGVDWLAVAIVAGVLLAVAVLVFWALRSQRPRSPRALLAGVSALLDDAIDDVLGEADPRQAVIKAWARLERVLARHGLPRRDAEAPFEYAARARAEMGVEEVSLERLADLFEWARFSLNEVTPAMREEALSGLVAVRDGLRAAA